MAHEISQPANKKIKLEGGVGQITWADRFGKNRSEQFNRQQQYIDSECIRRMAPDTPRLSGNLIKSATRGTTIGSGLIVQRTPYARRQYYEHKSKSYWFERMKNRDKDSILKGAEQIT